MQVPRFSVLVVEDDPVIRQYVMRALARESFRCDGAANGLEGKQAMDRNAYDVVVSDLNMPIKNGHALAVDILAMPKRPALVILTGIAEPRIEEDLRRRGVDAIVHKPVNLPIFAKCIHKLATQRQAILEPHSEHDSTSAIDFLNVIAVAAESKYPPRSDFWKAPTPNEPDPNFVDNNGTRIYSSSNRDIPSDVQYQIARQESAHQSYQTQAAYGATGVLDSPTDGHDRLQVNAAAIEQTFAAVENSIRSYSEQAFYSAQGGLVSTPEVINRSQADVTHNSSHAPNHLARHLASLPPAELVEAIATPPAAQQAAPPQLSPEPVRGTCAEVMPTQKSLREALQLEPVGAVPPSHNFYGLALGFLCVLVLYLITQLTIQISEIRKHDATVAALKELGASVIAHEDGTAIDMQDRDVAEMMALLEEVRNLRALVLARSNVTDNQLGLLKDQSNLRTLDLADTPVTDAGMDQLMDLKSLETLNLSGTAVTTGKRQDMQRRNPKLKIDRVSLD